MICANKSKYDRIFQQVTHKVGLSALNYINIFQNAQAISVSLGNSYSEDHLMHILLDKFHQGENIYCTDINITGRVQKRDTQF